MRLHPKLKSYEPTQQQLKSVLDYRPQTGIFVWTKNASPGNAGKIAGIVVNGYRRIHVGDRLYLGHHLAWFFVHGEWPKGIDHINGDRDDNRIDNLRLATASQNGANKRKSSANTSGRKGVYKTSGGKFVAAITCLGKDYHVGTFATLEEASQAYLSAAKALFGEFAHDGERAEGPLYKIKAGPYHPLRFKWGNDDPRLEPLTPDQPVIDRLALNPRAARRLRAIEREANQQKKDESFVQLQIEKMQKKRDIKEKHWTERRKSLQK